MKRFAMAICVATIPACPAVADPMPMPEVDYEGEWQMDPGNGVQGARIHYSAILKAFRIDMTTPAGEASVIRDMASGDMLMWGIMGQDTAMKLRTPNRIPDGAPTGETEEVNGEPCAIWVGADVRVCLGEGNIPLSAKAHGTSVQLLNVERREQEAALFEPPAGIKVMELPAAVMKQMEKMQGGIPGKSVFPF